MPAPESAKSVTFILTEQCNFRCEYCYLVDKKDGRVMSFEVASAAIDYLLGRPDLFPERRLIIEFIGGEPFLEVDLIERIIDYLHLRAYELQHPWAHNAMFTFTTNGALYGTPKVQRLIERFQHKMSMTISIDGPEHVHDVTRRSIAGHGTYAQVAKNIPLWLSQFPHASTKATFNHNNVPNLAESILHLMALGIREVNANVVFENEWEDGDDAILEQQLDILGSTMVEQGLWRSHTCSFFKRGIGKPVDPRNDGNWCGTGKMLAIDVDGNYYPCNRFVPFSLASRPARNIGSIDAGLNLNRVRPFVALRRSAQSTPSCIECEVATGCAWCNGLNYQDAKTATIYERATHICRMHKARVRANERFWAKVDAAVERQEAG